MENAVRLIRHTNGPMTLAKTIQLDVADTHAFEFASTGAVRTRLYGIDAPESGGLA